FLETLPCVTRVIYCGLPSHPSYKQAKKYFNGNGSGVINFHLPVQYGQSEQLMRDTSPFVPTTSFGEAHCLVLHPKQGFSRIFKREIKHPEECKVPNVAGYWYRFACGLQPAEEVIQGFVEWFSRFPFMTKEVAK